MFDKDGKEVKLSWFKVFYPGYIFKIMDVKWGRMTFIVGILYVIQFSMVVGDCNFYSDTTRFNTCIEEDGTLIEGEDASQIYDIPLFMCAIYHII